MGNCLRMPEDHSGLLDFPITPSSISTSSTISSSNSHSTVTHPISTISETHIPINLIPTIGTPLNPMPQSYVSCNNNVCCVTECWNDNGTIKCYTHCNEKVSGNQLMVYTP